MMKKTWYKSGFKWLHRNRLAIVIFLFVVVVPIALVTSIYLGSHLGNRKVSFDQTTVEEKTFISRFNNPNDLRHIDLNIEWQSFKAPVLDVNDQLTGGYYTFNISYSVKESHNISNVSVVPVLQTAWTPIKSLGQSTPLATTNKLVTVNFNHELPIRPLWFVKVTDPVLYLKITYTRTLANQTQVSEVEYVKFGLSELNPITVVPNN